MSNETDIASLKTEMEFVKLQVSNHIPTAIKEVDRKVNKLGLNMAFYTGGLAVIVAATNIIINIYTP